MKTTIQVTGKTKRLLDEHKTEDETYNAVVKRLAGQPTEQLWSEAELRDLMNEQISERVVPEAQR